jgi:hypothetical protein
MMKRKLLSILALLCLTVSGAGAQTYTNTVNINEASGDVEVNSGHWLITGTGEPTTNTIVISGGWVTLSNVNISSSNKPCIECKTYDTYIFLADETKNTLTATGEKKAAIQVDRDLSLTIMGSTGELNATSGKYAAGIEGGYQSEINIKGGNIVAQGGQNGAGIGSGNGSQAGGNINISGGNITAQGGKWGAGIGAGQNYCYNINISGGNITAQGGQYGAGIGCGRGGTCSYITISGGIITANGDANAACIGCGQLSSCDYIYINDGVAKVTATKTNNGRFIGSTARGSCDWTIDGNSTDYVPVEGSDESTFPHYTSYVSGNTWTLTHKPYNVTANLVDGVYWSTFYSKAGNYQAPVGTQVFAVNLDGTAIEMTEIGDRIVKSGEGVVLKQATESSDATTTIIMTLTEDEATGDFSANSLTGTMTSITNPGNAYVLNKTTENGVGFYKLSSEGTIGANKAYLTSTAGAREYFLFDEATGIAPIDNGQWIMDNEAGAVYDLQGRRVSQPAKGLYIVRLAEGRLQGKNGKKYIKK